MKTLLTVKLALAPLVVFWVASAFGHSLPGAAGGAMLAAAAAWWQRRTGRDPIFAWICLATLAAIALGLATGVPLVARQAAAWSYLGLGAGATLSVVLRRPWTAAFAASSWSGASGHPLFRRINTFMSSLWAGMFLYLGVARLVALPALASWLPLAAAIVLSMALPPLWVRSSLAARIRQAQGYRWAVPRFGDPAEDADVLVVGAGLGGLTAAALLAQAGLRVQVLEQHVVPGGFAHTWLRKGRDGDARPVFRFDSGVHDVSGWWEGAPVHGLLGKLGLGERLRWARLDHRFLLNGETLDIPRRWDDYVEQLASRFPAEAPGIRALMAEIRAIHAAMYSEAPRHSGVPGAPRSVAGMLAFARSHPLAVRWMELPFSALVSARVSGAEAQRAICGLSGYVTDAPAAVSVAEMVPLFGYYLHGGHYPLGGSGELAAALVEVLERRGGRLRVKTAVAGVQIVGGAARGVRLSSGETLRAAAVVLNADFLAATRQLIEPEQWPEEFRARTRSLSPSCSAFGVHLGVRGEFPGARPIIHVSGEHGSAEIVVPSLVDPSAAPRGYSTVEILRLMPHAEAATWFREPGAADDKALRHSAEYQNRKRALGDRLIQAAEEALPGLASRIVCRVDASPVTYRRYDWSSAGAIYGVSGAPRRIGAKSPLAGLLFAGAATHGAGVEAVMISGAQAAESLLPGLLDS